jgi:hypothetical protein
VLCFFGGNIQQWIHTNLKGNIHFEEYYYQANMASRIVTRLPREVRLIGWKLPAEGRVKLNMIGACKDGCKAGCGGFIRDR